MHEETKKEARTKQLGRRRLLPRAMPTRESHDEMHDEVEGLGTGATSEEKKKTLEIKPCRGACRGRAPRYVGR